MTVTLRNIKLTVVNDIICPNCCIGQHELLSAISYAQNTLRLPLHFDIEFLPYRLISTACLNDDMPNKVEKTVFFQAKLGDNFPLLQSAVAKWSEEKGIPLGFKGVMSQTTRAHRLSRKAFLIGGQKLQLPLLCELYRSHLGDGEDIADFEILGAISEKVGIMSKEKAIEFLKSDELEAEVNQFCQDAKDKGITGVPLTVIDGKWAVSGGQSSEVFLKIFQKMAEGTTTTPTMAPAAPQHDLVAQPLKPLC